MVLYRSQVLYHKPSSIRIDHKYHELDSTLKYNNKLHYSESHSPHTPQHIAQLKFA